MFYIIRYALTSFTNVLFKIDGYIYYEKYQNCIYKYATACINLYVFSKLKIRVKYILLNSMQAHQTTHTHARTQTDSVMIALWSQRTAEHF
jgi:hypothetical protein